MRSVPSYHFGFFEPQKTSDPVLVKCSRAQHRRLHLRASPPTCSPARLQSRNQLLPRSLRSSSTNASLGLARTVPTSVETSRSRAPTNAASAPSHTVRFRTKIRLLVCPGHSRADRALGVLATRAHAPATYTTPMRRAGPIAETRNPRGIGSAARPSRACSRLPSLSSTAGVAASRAYSPCIFSRAALLCRAEQATRFRGERQRRDYDKLAVTADDDRPALRERRPPLAAHQLRATLAERELRIAAFAPRQLQPALGIHIRLCGCGWAESSARRAPRGRAVVHSRLRAPDRSRTTKLAGAGGREAEAVTRARAVPLSRSLPL
ncbi:hypothetical protein K438DRAFT_1975435 [Mycena galopus ATCC 62051]|nr:hypothetical protein K438DRAFT_1975435 [Mycena galopus ATCC 62051]